MKLNYFFLLLLILLELGLCAQEIKPTDPNVKEAAQKKISYEQRIQMSRINDVYIPVNTEDAIKELNRLSSPEGRDKLKLAPEDTIASKLHFSLGRWILLNWSLEEGSRLSHFYKMKGVSFPDDMIDLILRSYHRSLLAKPTNEDDLVKQYKDKRKKEMEEELKKKPVLKKETRYKPPHNE
ncbi:MAG TPA: hypothetical protein PK006_13360 [Saprospiraceae bacterium]|nr:hypothetical protein [Saprospiraceae bacterium]